MSDTPNTRETALSVGNSIFQLLEELTSSALNSTEVKHVISNQSSERLDQTLSQIAASNFEPRNAIILSEGALKPTTVTSFAHNSSEVLKKISEKALNDLIEKIPKYYAKSLDNNIERSYDTSIEDLLRKPQETFSDFTKNSLNKIFKKIENPYFSISIEDFKITVKKKETTIRMAAKISIKPVNPYVRVLFEANGVQKQLCKVIFQTDGNIDFTEIVLVAQKTKLEINLGKLDAKFRISLKNLEVLDKTVLSPEEDQDVALGLVTKNITKEFSKITLIQTE